MADEPRPLRTGAPPPTPTPRADDEPAPPATPATPPAGASPPGPPPGSDDRSEAPRPRIPGSSPPPGTPDPLRPLASRPLLPSGVPGSAALGWERRPNSGVAAFSASSTIPVWRDAAGNRRSPEDIATDLQHVGSRRERIAQIAALVGQDGDGTRPMAYVFKSGTGLLQRPTVRQSLSSGGVECDGFAGVAAWLLHASGAVPASDVYGVQLEGHGQHHNVAVFRDPDTGHWSVLNYNEDIVAYPTARGPEEAIAQWANLNGDMVILYRVASPDARPEVLYHIRSEHAALRAGFDFAPGIGGAMTGNRGMVRGFNDTDPRAAANGLGLRGELTVGNGRLESEARLEPGMSNAGRLGVGYLHMSDSGTMRGLKVVARGQPGQGSEVVIGGEIWRADADGFFGLVAGVDVRHQQPRAGGTEQVTTVAPFVALSGGRTHTLIDRERFNLSWFWNLYGSVTVPFGLSEEDRNGLPGNMLIDRGGAMGLSTAGANSGFRAGVRLTDNLTLRTEAVGHTMATDPTLPQVGPWLPLRSAVDGGVSLEGRFSPVNLSLGLTGQLGALFDRDPRYRAWLAASAPVGDRVTVNGGVTAGEMMSGVRYLDARLGFGWRTPWDVTLGVSGGASVVEERGERSVTPMLQLSVGR